MAIAPNQLTGGDDLRLFSLIRIIDLISREIESIMAGFAFVSSGK